MYALRPFGSDWLYRIPDWLAGSAAVGLGAWVAWLGEGREDREDAPGKTRALVTAILLGGSYLLVHYASEARGYSLALVFGLLAVGIALRDGLRPLSRRAPLAWVSLILAMVSLALAGTFLSPSSPGPPSGRSAAGGGATRQSPWSGGTPCRSDFSASTTCIPSRHGERRGPAPGTARAVVNAIEGTTGLPLAYPAPLVLIFAVTVTGIGLFWLHARGSDLWIFYLFGMIVSPALVAYGHRAELYVGRHLIVSMTLWLLLAGRLLARLASRGGLAKAVVAATLAAFLVANAVRTVPLLRNGRGSFREALRYMESRTSGDGVRVIGDQDTRNGILVEYYGPRVAPRVRYVKRRDRPGTGSDWYIACLPPPPGECCPS